MREVGDVDSRGRARVQTSFEGHESMTVQSDAHMADITEILRKYKQVGIVENLNLAEMQFKDVSEFTDLKDAIDQSRLAEVEFLKLPSKVREIFDHDVAVWLDTAHDEEKRDALVAGGFIKDPDVDPPETRPAPRERRATTAESVPEGSGEGNGDQTGAE